MDRAAGRRAPPAVRRLPCGAGWPLHVPAAAGRALQCSTPARAPVQGSNFNGSRLVGSQFARAQAQGAQLRGADLTDINGFATAFDGADLEVRWCRWRLHGRASPWGLPHAMAE